MISKKELQHQQINNAFSHIRNIRQQIRDLIFHVDENKQNLEACSKISTLTRQVQCGVVGHKFQLVEVVHSAILSKNFGLFRCKECGLTIKRELTKQEVEAAKKLGMIK